jgi:hypothetical protein
LRRLGGFLCSRHGRACVGGSICCIGGLLPLRAPLRNLPALWPRLGERLGGGRERLGGGQERICESTCPLARARPRGGAQLLVNPSPCLPPRAPKKRGKSGVSVYLCAGGRAVSRPTELPCGIDTAPGIGARRTRADARHLSRAPAPPRSVGRGGGRLPPASHPMLQHACVCKGV